MDPDRQVDAEAYVRCRQRPCDQLTLATDIEHARRKADGDAYARNDERGRCDQGLRDRGKDRVPARPGRDGVPEGRRADDRAHEERPVCAAEEGKRGAEGLAGGGEEVPPGVQGGGGRDDDEDGADEEPEHDGQESDHYDVGLGHPAQRALPPGPHSRRHCAGVRRFLAAGRAGPCPRAKPRLSSMLVRRQGSSTVNLSTVKVRPPHFLPPRLLPPHCLPPHFPAVRARRPLQR